MIRKLSSVYVLTHSGFAIRCCPVADSQLILELFFLHIRGGCSPTVLLNYVFVYLEKVLSDKVNSSGKTAFWFLSFQFLIYVYLLYCTVHATS